MKAFTSILLAFLYLGVSSGFTLRTHYCMGRLAGIGIGYESPKKCGKCGMHKGDGHKGGCCKDEHQLIKINTDQQSIATAILLLSPLSVDLPARFIEPFPPIYISELKQYPVNHDPPRNNTVAVYLRNCVFLI